MSDFRKARIKVTAVYRNGEVLNNLQEHAVPARVDVLRIPGASDKLRELQIRLVVDSRSSEELLEGICNGDVSLEVEQMPTPVERETIK